VDDKGFIRFSSVGGLNTRNLVNERVVFANGTYGVIGAKEEAFKDKPSLDKLYIDIGAENKEEAQKKVSVGDSAVFVGSFIKSGDTVISKALDNRAGCAILLAALSKINENENDLYFVFTVQEEVGLRGAKTAAFAIEPDIAVAVDVTDTGDTPGAPVMAVEMGKGAAIKVMDRSIMCDASVRAKMVDVAKENNIPYQLEIMTDGGTDAGAIHLTKAGIKTGGISVPTRYIHSPSETSSIKDIENCVNLVYNLAVSQW
jgi:endoglucanase